MQIYNHDLYHLVKKIRRFKFELVKSVSSGLSESNQYDLARLNSYLDALEVFHQWIIDQPELDLPETSPMAITLPDAAELPAPIENDDLALIVNLMDLMEGELVNSQSARRSTGIVIHDQNRYLAMLAKIRAFLSTYVASSNPIDLPESSPLAEMSGPGRMGV